MTQFSHEEKANVFAGALLGTAVGDALGLPAEGLSRARLQRRWPGPWKHRFLAGRGMISDDTEHTLFVAQALLAAPSDAAVFQRSLAWKLRLWLLGVPAGIGFATLRSILKLWLGFPPARSGVYSAGNGPAMRSAIIGAYFADDPAQRKAYVTASTRLTHTDPRAETAALAVAETAAWAALGQGSVADLLALLPNLGQDAEWRAICAKLVAALAKQLSVGDFALELGLERGVTGYAYHTVPVALYAVLHHGPNFRVALEETLHCGGDTDTVGAIVGALSGAQAGRAGIPEDWLAGICEWPRSVRLLEQVASRLVEQKATHQALGPAKYFWPGLVPRNLLFVAVVLAHGFRRLLPP